MIIMKLEGGLGNQMFQYAFGRRLAMEREVPLKLDISTYGQDKRRTFDLRYFCVQVELASREDIAAILGKNRVAARVNALLDLRKPYFYRRFIHHKEFAFDSNLLRVADDVYLYGHWQSEKYFETIANTVRSELVVTQPPDSVNAEMAERIQSNAAVCVHVRRGDYITNPDTFSLHGVCPLEYYTAAAEWLRAKGVSPVFYVFSDDPDWAEDNLDVGGPTIFVTHNEASRGFEDMRLMALCKHYIIANSTFSWWGAWLGSDPNKLVVAPRRWFSAISADTSNLFPAGWHLL